MAEAIARHLIDEGLLGPGADLFVASAGVAAGNGVLTTHEAVTALHDMGIEFAGTSKRLTADMVRKADLVLCMTSGHVQRALELIDGAETPPILPLDPDGDIEDPIGLEQRVYYALAQRLKTLIAERLKELLGDEDRAGDGPSRSQPRSGAGPASS
jgi:protein-tyrosine-phosphatase